MQKRTGFSNGNVRIRKGIALCQAHRESEMRPCCPKWRQHETMIVLNRQGITGDRRMSTPGQQIEEVIRPLLPFRAVSTNMLSFIKDQEQPLVTQMLAQFIEDNEMGNIYVAGLQGARHSRRHVRSPPSSGCEPFHV